MNFPNSAAELGRGPTHVYALIKRYRADPRLTTLLPRRDGPRKGTVRLDPQVDAIIENAVQDYYYTRQKPRITDLMIEIHRQCGGFRS